MVVTNFSKARKIPSSTSLSTKKSSPTTTNFAAGIFTYKPNDTMDYDEIYLAQNARFDRIGEYCTRRGLAKLCDPVGKSLVSDNYSLDYTMVNAETVTQSIVANDPVYSIELTVATTNSTDYGIIQVSLVNTDDEIVAVSCWDGASTTPESHEFVFKDAPTGNLAIHISSQQGSKQQFRVATVSSPAVLMMKRYTATAGSVISLFEANIDGIKTVLFVFKDTNGTSTLYRMADNGTITSIRQLPSGVTAVRFSQDINKIRYADGVEGPRILDPSSNWSDSAISTIDLKTGVDLSIKTSNIMDGTEDNILYFDADTTTQAVWTYPYGFTFAPEADFTTTATLNAYVPGATTTTTVSTSTLTPVSESHLVSAIAVGDLILDDTGNYGEVSVISGTSLTVTSISHAAEPINSYDKFDRDFRQNFPAIETGDPLTAMFNLGGVIYMLTRRNKYYMYSQTADVWSQETSSAQHGTFSQESVACNLNYAYYAADDGVYIFDGSSESSITQNTIQNTYDAIQGKESIRLELFGNHLYMFYSSVGNGVNDSALVYNTNLKLWESFDTGLPICAIIGRKNASNRFICGSSKFGQLYTFENGTNAHADVGAPIAFDLETAYLHFGTPSQLHRVAKWRPEFATTEGDYTVKCGYSLDFSDNVEYAFSVKLKNGTPVLESYVWDNPPSYGVNIVPTVQSTTTKVYGEFRRIQFRYQLHTAYEPVNLKAVTMSIQTQRLR